MLRRNEILARALAVFVGIALFSVPSIILGSLLGDDTPLTMPVQAVAYGVCGAVFGFLWPVVGWRMGLYLSAIWLPAFLFALLLGGELLIEGRWMGILRDLMEFMLMLIAACFGAEVGAIVRRWKSN